MQQLSEPRHKKKTPPLGRLKKGRLFRIVLLEELAGCNTVIIRVPANLGQLRTRRSDPIPESGYFKHGTFRVSRTHCIDGRVISNHGTQTFPTSTPSLLTTRKHAGGQPTTEMMEASDRRRSFLENGGFSVHPYFSPDATDCLSGLPTATLRLRQCGPFSDSGSGRQPHLAFRAVSMHG